MRYRIVLLNLILVPLITGVAAGQTDTFGLTFFSVEKDVRIRHYFDYMEKVADTYLGAFPKEIREHLLVHSNWWILDRLVRTDYYLRAEEGEFVRDQKKMVILEKGDVIEVPDLHTLLTIQQELASLSLDVNIPEFRIRIFREKDLLWEFPVRVGRNTEKFLAAIDRVAVLRTQTGSGRIVRIFKDPSYINPVTNERYRETMRDDGRITAMPLVPWMETEINGRRNGQLIHPTTNPVTLGKAYSNGCIGTGEKEAWLIYYHAPVGTPVRIRYDLEVENKQGDSIQLPDIYNRWNSGSSTDINHIEL